MKNMQEVQGGQTAGTDGGQSVLGSGTGARGVAGPCRIATAERRTKETCLEVSVNLDGAGVADISTGLPFFDHMLSALCRHSGIDLRLRASGDLEVDAHHTVEDTGLAIGEAIGGALGGKLGIRRFASIALPLDEALIEVALDVSGRPFLEYGITLPHDVLALGDPPFDPQLAEEFWRAFTTAAMVTMHVRMISGKNTHHVLEASFKAVARCLADAVRVEGVAVPSTKGVI